MAQQRLFTPVKVGHANLTHRIALAPLTRFRADDKHVHLPIAKDYYEQRASVPGTLLITEATFISPQASGMDNVPGIYNDAQIAAWRTVTDAVHAKGCYIFCQLWALGRRAELAILAREEGGPYPVVSASNIPGQPNGEPPQPLTQEGINSFISDYATAARNAILAGFDGVEIHGANGYLIDQFLSEDLNQRTDAYGGSIAARSRLALEVMHAVIAALDNDASRVAIRLSPWTDHGIPTSKPPTDLPAQRIPQFHHLITALTPLNLAYLHLVESRLSGSVSSGHYDTSQTRNDALIAAWRPSQRPIMLAGGFTPSSAADIAERYAADDVLVAFGRYYISTPDLPWRVRHGLELNSYDRDTFYERMSERGYTDYPFHPEYPAAEGAAATLRAKA